MKEVEINNMEGAVEKWDIHGYGIIRGSDKKTYLAHYSAFDEYKKTKKKISMEVGQDVSFTPSKREGKDQAEGIIYDTRSALFRFAYFYDYEDKIAQLAKDHAVSEKWPSSSFDESEQKKQILCSADKDNWLGLAQQKAKPNGPSAKQQVDKRVQATLDKKKYEVLFSFFERTFERIKLEDKIIYSDTGGAVFNTALGNKFDKDVFAVFKKSKPNSSTKYVFDKYADENFVGKHFSEIPEPPNYFLDILTKERVPSDHLLFNVDLKIFPDDTHLFDERRSRFPESWQGMSDEECSSKFQQLMERTRNRVRRNFRAAVPFYYPALKKIQMLLPITFDMGTEQAKTSAVVVSREGAGYSAETIMPLDWAYKNARLLAKPDREDWLDF